MDTFYIIGLFPTGASDPQIKNALGFYPKASAQYAVKHINQLGFLAKHHNVTLKLEAFNSGCQGIGSGTHGLIEAVQFARRSDVFDTSTGEIHKFLYVSLVGSQL
jgi:sugar phosphate isomerase/epimerase